jgi:hypothetical protein
MFESRNSAGRCASPDITNAENRSLKGIRKVKVAALVKDQSVGSGRVVAKEDRVVTAVRLSSVLLGGAPTLGTKATSSIGVVSLKSAAIR